MKVLPQHLLIIKQTLYKDSPNKYKFIGSLFFIPHQNYIPVTNQDAFIRH